MGVTGLWNHLDHACTISSLEDEAWRYYRASPYKALRLGIDSSLWMFHGKGLPGEVGPNASLRMIFYRLVNLFSLPILPVFVFDGPRKPSFKRGKETSRALHWKAQKETDEFKLLIRAFGFLERTAPGEAEAELAWMNEHNIIDVVLTDDVDVLLFGAKRVFRNAGAGLPGTLATKKRHMARTLSNESNGLAGPSRRQASGKYLKSQDMPMYTVKKAIAVDKNKPCESCQGWLMSAYASDTEEGDASGDESRDAEDEELNLPLDREGLILIACLSGGDYNLSGVISCGPTISKVLASLGFGTRLVNVLKASVASDAPPVPSYEGPRWMPRLELNEALWRRQRDAVLAEICQELETNESGLLHKRQKAVAQKVRDNFLTTPDSVSVLASYIWPNTTLHCLKLGCTSAQFELDWTKSGDASHLTENTFDVDRIDRSSALEWSSTQDTMCLDLVRLLVLFRKKFAWTDEQIRRKTQMMLAEGILVRSMRAEALLEDANGNRALVYDLREKVTLARVARSYNAEHRAESRAGCSSASTSCPASRPSAILARSSSSTHKTTKNTLIQLKEIVRTRPMNGRLEYRVSLDDSSLDQLVQSILDKLQMEPPPPPSPSTAGAASLLQDFDVVEDESQGPSSKPKCKPQMKEGPRLEWITQELLADTRRGKELISEWESKQKGKAQKVQAKKKGSKGTTSRSFSRSSSVSSTVMSKQSLLADALSPFHSLTKSTSSKSSPQATPRKKKEMHFGFLSDDSLEDDTRGDLVETRNPSKDRLQRPAWMSRANHGAPRTEPTALPSSPATGRDYVFSKFFEAASDDDKTFDAKSQSVSQVERIKGKSKEFTRTLSVSSAGSQKREHAASSTSAEVQTPRKPVPLLKKGRNASPEDAIVLFDDSPPVHEPVKATRIAASQPARARHREGSAFLQQLDSLVEGGTLLPSKERARHPIPQHASAASRPEILDLTQDD